MAGISQWLPDDFSYYFTITLNPFLRFAICTAFFALPLHRKRNGWFLLLLIVIYAVSIFAIAFVRLSFDTFPVRLIARALNYLTALPLLLLLFTDAPPRVMLCWCGGVATEEFAVHLYYLILFFQGKNDYAMFSLFRDEYYPRDLVLYLLFIALIAFCSYRLFGRGALDVDKVSERYIYRLALGGTATLAVLCSLAREYEAESRHLYALVLFFILAVCLLILSMRSGHLIQSRYRQEIAMMEELLKEQRRQYERIRENIDLINLRCHDLKHQLANFQGRLTEQEVSALQEAIEIYDGTIKTGSEVLDVILYEKQLVCQKESIRLSCMVDGAALSFLSTTHLYALFDNAIGNAIEAVCKLPDPEMRIIDITGRRENGRFRISVVNYYDGELAVSNGLPATTKADKVHHGLGVRSMKYIAEQYHGEIRTIAQRRIYTLEIQLPVPE